MKKMKETHRGKMGGKDKIPRSATFNPKKPKFPQNYTFSGTGTHSKS